MTIEETETPEQQSTRRRSWPVIPAMVLLGATVALGLGIRNGLHARIREGETLANATNVAAVPAVRVVRPAAGSPLQEIVLPGNTQAFTDSPIYARTNGYLTHWYYDIGARVKKGDLLAEIET